MNPITLFQLFIERANELERTRFIRSLPDANWRISLDLPSGAKQAGTTVTYPEGSSSELPSSIIVKDEVPKQDKSGMLAEIGIQTRLPDNDDLTSFLVTFRKFVAQGELLHLCRIYSKIDGCLPDGFTKRAFRQSRQRWRCVSEENCPTTVFVGGRVLAPEVSAVRLWIESLEIEESPLSPFTIGHVKRLIRFIPQTINDARIRVMALLTLDCGATLNEGLQLSKADIDYPNCVLRVHDGHKRRVVWMSPRMADLLKRYDRTLARHLDPFIFGTRTLRKHSRRNAVRDFHNLLIKCRMKPCSWGCLKRAYETIYVRRQVERDGDQSVKLGSPKPMAVASCSC